MQNLSELSDDKVIKQLNNEELLVLLLDEHNQARRFNGKMYDFHNHLVYILKREIHMRMSQNKESEGDG